MFLFAFLNTSFIIYILLIISLTLENIYIYIYIYIYCFVLKFYHHLINKLYCKHFFSF